MAGVRGQGIHQDQRLLEDDGRRALDEHLDVRVPAVAVDRNGVSRDRMRIVVGVLDLVGETGRDRQIAVVGHADSRDKRADHVLLDQVLVAEAVDRGGAEEGVGVRQLCDVGDGLVSERGDFINTEISKFNSVRC